MLDDDAIDLLESTVRVRSVSGDERDVGRHLCEAMSRSGFDAALDDAGNAVGVIGSGEREIALLGHMDTVPGDIPVRREGGRLHGRGTVDAKGPLVAFVVAAARVASTLTGTRVRVIGCVEEEAPSSRGARFAADAYRPDLVIVGEPSGSDTVCIGYKGYLRARLGVEVPCGHGAHDRRTACEQVMGAFAAVERAAAGRDAGRKKLHDRLLVTGVGLGSDSDGLHERARVDLTLRLPPDLAPIDAESWLREAVAPGIEVTLVGSMPAWSVGRTDPAVRALAGAIRARGHQPRYVHKTGTADVNLVAPAWSCPAAVYGPGDSSLDHTPGEYIEIGEFLEGVSVLEAALERVAAGWTAPDAGVGS